MSFALGFLLVIADGLIPPPPIIGPPVNVVDIELNGKPYRMPVPDNYCMPKVTAASLMTEISRGNVVISPQAYFLRCDKAGKIFGDQEFIYVKYFKGIKLKSQSKADYIASTAPNMQQRFDTIYDGDAITDRIEKKMAVDGKNAIELSDLKPLPLGHDDSCIYIGVKSSITIVRTGEKASIFVLTCSTSVNGNMVTIDVATEMEKKLDLAVLKQRLNIVANSIVASRPKATAQ